MNAESEEPLQPSGASSTTGVRPAPRAPGQVVVCGWCSAEVTVPTRGRVPKWCSGTCRHRAWEQARAAASGRAAVTVVDRVVETVRTQTVVQHHRTTVPVAVHPTSAREWARLLEELAAEGGVSAVVVAPIGFVSDHMEVVHDLDTEAAETAQKVGMPFVRVATPGTDDLFVEGLVDLLLERAAEARGEVVLPETWVPGDVRPSVCAPGCCPNLRAVKPALCGSD